MAAKTERADYLFRVSDHDGPTCWITTELCDHPDLTIVGKHGFLGFDLYDESPENARMVADFLNKHIRWTNATIFEEHPMYRQARTRYVNGEQA